jgi:uncharacterized protein (DUF433 family)
VSRDAQPLLPPDAFGAAEVERCPTADTLSNRPSLDYERSGSRQERSMADPKIITDPEIMGGTPVFAGTRVPVRILFEHLEAGDSLDVFLDDFPTVSRELAIAVLEEARLAVAGPR